MMNSDQQPEQYASGPKKQKMATSPVSYFYHGCEIYILNALSIRMRGSRKLFHGGRGGGWLFGSEAYYGNFIM